MGRGRRGGAGARARGRRELAAEARWRGARSALLLFPEGKCGSLRRGAPGGPGRRWARGPRLDLPRFRREGWPARRSLFVPRGGRGQAAASEGTLRLRWGRAAVGTGRCRSVSLAVAHRPQHVSGSAICGCRGALRRAHLSWRPGLCPESPPTATWRRRPRLPPGLPPLERGSDLGTHLYSETAERGPREFLLMYSTKFSFFLKPRYASNHPPIART